MLVIMEHRNVHAFTQFLLNVEAFWCLDVFKVNPAKGWFECSNDINDFVWIIFSDFDVKYIDAGEFLEQNAFTFHNRFRR